MLLKVLPKKYKKFMKSKVPKSSQISDYVSMSLSQDCFERTLIHPVHNNPHPIRSSYVID